MTFKTILRTRVKLMRKAADWAKGGDQYGWDFSTLRVCWPELWDAFALNTSMTIAYLEKVAFENTYDDFGDGKYDYIGVAERIPLHAKKALEFMYLGDAFNAEAHGRACMKLCATGMVGSEPYRNAYDIVRWFERAAFRRHPNEQNVQTQHPCTLARETNPMYLPPNTLKRRA